MKSLLRNLLCLLLAASLALAACSGSPSGKPTDADTAENETEEDGEDTPEALEPLWNQNVSLKASDVPSKAFKDGAERAVALAPDGVTFLMGGGTAPYLYNTDSGKKKALAPADKDSEEYLREALIMRSGLAVKATEEQMAVIRERINGMKAEELTEELFSDFGRVMAPRPWITFYSTENFLCLTDPGYLTLLVLDCDTGRYTCGFENAINPCAVQDGKFLYFVRPLSTVTLFSLKTRKAEVLEMNDPSVLTDGARVTAAGFLPDGTVCAVLAPAKISPEEPAPFYLAVRKTAEKKATLIPLGSALYQHQPDRLVPVGSAYAAAFNSVWHTPECAPYLVSLDGSSVFRLVPGEKDAVNALSPEEFEKLPPDDPSASSLIVIDGLADGETLLLQDLNDTGALRLYAPAAGETATLVSGKTGFRLITSYSGNHYDWFYDYPLMEGKALYQIKIK